MTCKDCIHQDMCFVSIVERIEDGCQCFKDKSKFIELPCKVGDIVYVDSRIVGRFGFEEYKAGIYIAKVVSFTHTKDDMFIKLRFKYKQINQTMMNRICIGAIGKTIFLTKEEAEKKLKELEKGYKK